MFGWSEMKSFVSLFFSDRHQGLSLWVPFQNAASNVTSLYKGMCFFSVKVASQLMNKTVSISFFFHVNFS